MVIEQDDFGPETILEVYDPKTGMRGFTCLFSTVLGPAKGGIRMTTKVTREEVFRLAREMAWKCAIADLPFGGGKSGIVADGKHLPEAEKKAIVEAFSRAIANVCPSKYVAAPDVYMAEREMKWFAEANGDARACTGKPADMGGIPHEYGSTGFGVAHSTRVALAHAGININGASIAIEGFGNVGTFAMKFLTEWGAKVVAVTDSKGGIHDPAGLNYDELLKTKQETGSVVNHTKGDKISNEQIFGLEVDVLMPAALADVIHEENKNNVKAKIIVEGANISMSYETEAELEGKGIVIVPDFVANAGGVISSYVEYVEGTVEQMWKMVEEKVVANTQLVLTRAKEKSITARAAALEIAQERIRAKRGY
jgi:glutamate dehydrogenase (NAD(P)+)